MDVEYHVQDCLDLCATLQLQYSRWGKELAIGELMRLAVLNEPSKAMVLAVCRLLFRSNTGEPLRPPGLGEPWFLGDTSSENWPLEPIHLYNGVPFFIVNGWSVAGMPEQANWYLAYCLSNGIWNEAPYEMIEQQQLELGAHEFIDKGSWRRSLTYGEKMFLLAQIQVKDQSQAVAGPCETNAL